MENNPEFPNIVIGEEQGKDGEIKLNSIENYVEVVTQEQMKSINENDDDYEVIVFEDEINLNSMIINQNETMIGLGTDVGLRIYSLVNDIEPLLVKQNEDFPFKCGISCLSLLFETFIVAFLPDGTNKEYPKNKVIVWDAKYN